MTISVIQEAVSLNSAGSATAAVALSGTVAGNTIHVGVVINNGVTFASVTDTQGNTYGSIDQFNDTTSSRRYAHFAAYNIVGGAGANTITVTFSSSTTSGGIVVKEIGTVQPAPLDGHAVNSQQTPTTATDAVALSATNALQPALLSAFCFANASVAAPSAGTGFTAGTSSIQGNVSVRTESLRVTSTASQPATFTAGTNSAHTSFLAIFDELTSPPTGVLQAQACF